MQACSTSWEGLALPLELEDSNSRQPSASAWPVLRSHLGFGVLYGFRRFGVGISAQYTIGHDRPAWLEVAQLSLRIQMPLEPCASGFLSCALTR